MNALTGKMHLCNKARWDAASKRWAESADLRGLPEFLLIVARKPSS